MPNKEQQMVTCLSFILRSSNAAVHVANKVMQERIESRIEAAHTGMSHTDAVHFLTLRNIYTCIDSLLPRKLSAGEVAPCDSSNLTISVLPVLAALPK